MASTMDQIWDAWKKIITIVNDLWNTLKASQVENHLNFIDLERRMKALENAYRTIMHTQVPVIGLKNLSTSTPDGQLIKTHVLVL